MAQRPSFLPAVNCTIFSIDYSSILARRVVITELNNDNILFHSPEILLHRTATILLLFPWTAFDPCQCRSGCVFAGDAIEDAALCHSWILLLFGLRPRRATTRSQSTASHLPLARVVSCGTSSWALALPPCALVLQSCLLL
jgi:hypothetical protein